MGRPSLHADPARYVGRRKWVNSIISQCSGGSGSGGSSIGNSEWSRIGNSEGGPGWTGVVELVESAGGSVKFKSRFLSWSK